MQMNRVKTWSVYTETAASRSSGDSVRAAQWYGPFTEIQARQLAQKLNKLFVEYQDFPVRQTANVLETESQPFTWIYESIRDKLIKAKKELS